MVIDNFRKLSNNINRFANKDFKFHTFLQAILLASWRVLRSSFRPGQGTHQRLFCFANSLGITPKVPFANKSKFKRDAQRVCQAERSLMSPLGPGRNELSKTSHVIITSYCQLYCRFFWPFKVKFQFIKQS